MMKIKHGVAGVALVVVLMAGVGLFKMVQRAKHPDDSAMAKLRMGLKALGSDQAPVKIVEFSDFQCGACRKAQPVLNGLEKTYPGQIQIVFKHFPLPGHTWSGMAHQAAECANQRGVFWPYMNRLFEEQEQWMVLPNPVDRFLQYAASLKLNVDTFAACMMDAKTRERVKADSSEGEALSIKSTPTFFIDQERVVGLVELEKRANPIIRRKLGLPPLPEPVPTPSVQAAPVSKIQDTPSARATVAVAPSLANPQMSLLDEKK